MFVSLFSSLSLFPFRRFSLDSCEKKKSMQRESTFSVMAFATTEGANFSKKIIENR